MSDPDEEAARLELADADALIKATMQAFLDGNVTEGTRLARELGLAHQNRMIFAAGLFIGSIYHVRYE